MSVQDRLTDDLKTAMKARDELTRDVVRLMLSGIKNAEIEKRGAVDDAVVTDVLSRMVRQYRESIVAFRDGDREAAAAKEEAELAIVMRYLPEQLGADEIRALVSAAAAEVGASGPSDRGKVMKVLMPRLRGRADGSVAAAVVGEVLDAMTSA
ncbi:MAG: GatB/YqeY domain-containing protein [Chloroflexi bacterium]|nr:GatB/YqeY domain-containing protein [Chloroflexota bacterium]